MTYKTKTLIQEVTIRNFTDKDIVDTIYDNVKNKIQNTCKKDTGYITEIVSIDDIISNKISSINSDIIFKVKVTLKMLKPEKEKIYKGNVCMIFQKGIFIDIDNVFKVLITCNFLENYTFNNFTNSYINNETKEEINLGDNISVKLLGIKYSKNMFNCFGIIST